MKIIFLDYDGVVNNLVFFNINGEPTFGYVGPDGEKSIDRQVNDFQAIAWLNKICREFECKLVITSTWRWRDDYQECLYRAGLNEKVEILGRTLSDLYAEGVSNCNLHISLIQLSGITCSLLYLPLFISN